MSNDDTSDKVKTVLEAIGDLRFRFSEFQESIDRYLAYVEESWSKVKSRLAEFEARLAALEIKLSAVPVSSLTDEDLDFMQKELEELREKVEASYREQTDVRYAAARLWVDAILDPAATRDALLVALDVATRYDDGRPFQTGVLQV